MGQGTGEQKRLTGQASVPDDIISTGTIPLSQDNKFLFVVNTDDNSISGFRLGTDGELNFIDKIQTGEGMRILSLITIKIRYSMLDMPLGQSILKPTKWNRGTSLHFRAYGRKFAKPFFT